MAKRKLQHFAELLTFNNYFTYLYLDYQHDDITCRQKLDKFFQNQQQTILELGCGKGEYTIGLAKLYGNKNFIGIDYKGARLWKGCKTAIDEKIKNVAFIRSRAEFLDKLFLPNSISEIWITFPDPQLEKGKERKRLTAKRFVDIYRKILEPNGTIHLKTDNTPFFDFTLNEIKNQPYQLLFSTYDLYKDVRNDPILSIQTFYEKKFLAENKPIHYLKFRV